MKFVVTIFMSLFVMVSAVVAQDYPTKQVTLVIPFSPGGGNDTVGRFLAEGLSKLWGKAVVVENRPGGGTAVGAAHVARSEPDGYTFLLVSSSYTTNAASRTDLPFDPVADLVPAGIVGEGDQIILAGPNLKVKTLKELTELAKARTVFYATAGSGSTMHFYGAMLGETLGVEMVPVSYPGGSEALVDLVGGRVDVVVGAFTASQRHLDKGVVVLAQLSEARSKSLPDVPTIVEAGYPDALGENYWTILVPKDTPPTAVARIHEGIQQVMHSPEGTNFLANLDARPSDRAVAEIQVMLRSSIDRWKGLAQRIGINN